MYMWIIIPQCQCLNKFKKSQFVSEFPSVPHTDLTYHPHDETPLK
jgi:hypothetical protein